MVRHRKALQAQKSGRTVYPVTPKQFVEAWDSSESADEVSEKLNMPKAIVLARACNYRSMGVTLKKLKRKTKSRVDVQELNELIAQVHKRDGTEPPPPPRPRETKAAPLSEGEVASIVGQVLRTIRSSP